MKGSLPQSVLDYINDKNVMTLATQGEDGPWAAAVFFANKEFTFYFLSAPTTRHCKNMAENARVSATIQLDYDNWQEIKGVQMEGEAFLLDGAEKAMALAHYGSKFPVVKTALQSPKEIANAMNKASWYKLIPDRLYFIDNSKGLGNREEVNLENL